MLIAHFIEFCLDEHKILARYIKRENKERKNKIDFIFISGITCFSIASET